MLVRTLLEGLTPPPANEYDAVYDCDNGLTLISMEFTDLLQELYEDQYDVEVGESSVYIAQRGGAPEEVLEGVAGSIATAVKNTFAKISTAVHKLWEKIKAFFRNVKKFIFGTKKSNAEFIKKVHTASKGKPFKKATFSNSKSTSSDVKPEVHQSASSNFKEETGLATLNTVDFRMYDYNYRSMVNIWNDFMGNSRRIEDKSAPKQLGTTELSTKVERNDVIGGIEAARALMKSVREEENDAYEELFGVREFSEINKELWSRVRSGAKSEEDKKSHSIDGPDDIKKYTAMFREPEEMQKVIVGMESSYDIIFDKATSNIEEFRKEAEAEIKSAQGSSEVRSILLQAANMQVSMLSRMVSVGQKIIQASKDASTEHIRTLRSALGRCSGVASSDAA